MKAATGRCYPEKDPMGDNDGSSDAARGAQSENTTAPDPEPSRPGGFFSRVFDALSPAEAEAPSEPGILPEQQPPTMECLPVVEGFWQ